MIAQHEHLAAEAASADASAAAEDDSLPHVLVVDDSKECREVIIAFLRACGFRGIAAQDGLAAKLLLLSDTPVLVISDLQMPLYSGWELLAFCHAFRPQMPVLLISGLPLGRHPDIENWAAGFLAKPLEFAAFKTEINRLTSRAALRP